MKTLSVKVDDAIEDQVAAKAKDMHLTVSEVLRLAVAAYLQPKAEPPAQQSLEAVLYEVARSRAVLLRGLEWIGKNFDEKEMEEVGKDAEFYLEGRQQKESTTHD